MTPTLLRNAALATLMMAGGSGTGCSYLFVSAPPEHHQKLRDFDCTAGNAWPVLDTVVAAVYGIATVGAMNERSSADWRATALSTALVAGAFGSAAVVGYQRTQECRDARTELALRIDVSPTTAPGGDQQWLQSAPAVPDPWLEPGPAAPARRADPGIWAPAAPTKAAQAPASSPPPAASPDAGAHLNSNVPQPNSQED